MVKEKIEIEVIATPRGFEAVKKAIQMTADSIRVSMTGVDTGLTKSQIATFLAQKAFRGLAKGFISVAKAGYNFIKSLKGFQPAWLSVLFISMGIRRTLTGMINPVLELLGVFEIWRAVLISVLLPALMPLYDIFLNLMDWFFDMPEETQKLIGQFILFGAALATIVMVGSQIMLLLSSLGISFGLVAVLLLPFAGVFAGVTGAVFMFGEEARKTTDKIVGFINRGVEIAKQWLEGFVKKFMENLPLITELSNKILTALIDGVIAIASVLAPIVDVILDTLYGFFDKYKDRIFKMAGFIINTLIAFVITFLPSVIEIGKLIIDSIMEGIIKNKERIAKAWEEILALLTDIIVKSVPLLIDLGMVIGWALLKGFGVYMKENWEKVLFVGLHAVLGALAGGAIGSVAGPAGVIAGAKLGAGIGTLMGAGIAGSFQTGGIVPETGNYTLHKGETVIPSGEGINLSITNNISASINSSYDVRRLADELSSELAVNFERKLKMRGSI